MFRTVVTLWRGRAFEAEERLADRHRGAHPALAQLVELPLEGPDLVLPGRVAVVQRPLLARIADGTADRTRERRVVKAKRFGIEPMFEEDAIARMEELGHAFFVFVNAEDERVNVLYRRRDGDYGLIEPVIGGGYSGPEG